MNTFPSRNLAWADEGLREIEKGHAKGNKTALLVRSVLQASLKRLGGFTQRHCGKVILFGFLFLIVSAIGLIKAKLETNAENLWIEVDGRLEKELEYTKKALGEGYGGSNELLIQTPNEEGTNILTVQALKRHLDILMRVTNVSVDLFDQTWTLKDICYTISLPPMDDNIGLDALLPQLMPCVMISPLDCFWEGAKPLGPHNNVKFGSSENPGPLDNLKWKSLNPMKKVKFLEQYMLPRDYENLMGLLKEAGINSGYVMKPCLDPYDPECPKTAPNYKTKKKPDIGVELTGGCKGFATKYMDWPEELIVGGSVKNRSRIIRRADAYQSIIMLMGRQQLYTHWHNQAKVNHMEWTEDEAMQVLEAWKREFTKIINSVDQSKEDSTVLAFSSTSFNDLLKGFSQTSYSKVAIGYVLMLIYACVTLKHWGNAVDSHGALGFAGVLLVTVAVASGLGFCSFINIKFNAASTQILPFLALGLGVDDMFLLAHTYSSAKDKNKDPAVYCLASSGVSVFLTSFNNMFAFFMAALIPIPALRSFSLQAAIVVVFNFLAVIVIFPAMIVIDKNRRRSGKYDLLCCCERSSEPHSLLITPSTSVNDSGLLHYRYQSSCNSLSETPVLQGLSGTVILPGSVQAAASQTIHLPNMVTVQASASAELGTTPVTEWPRLKRMSSRKMAESGDIELSAMGNIRSNNGVGTTKARAGASANVVQVQFAGSVDREQRSSRGCDPRPPYQSQGTSRSLKIFPEQSGSDNNHCTCSEAMPEQRSKRYAYMSHARDTVINENAVVLSPRGESNMRMQPPRNVQFRVSANTASNGETSAMAMAECSSLRTSSSHSRSSPGLESMSRVSTSQSLQDSDSENDSRWSSLKKKLRCLSLSYFARHYYGLWLQKMPVKISVLFMFACLFAAGVYGCMKVEEGLDLTDVVPRTSPEHQFVKARSKYFSFYPMALVTKGGYDYPNGQELLYKFHDAFKKIPNIIKTPEGELPPFWLMYFRDWLIELQKAFDRDWAEERISYAGWQKNASNDGVMAYKLLAQTGEKERFNRSIVRSVRLVDDEGIVRPETFYKYLMVWYNMDFMGYTVSQANIKPEPEESWFNMRRNQENTAMRVDPPAPPTNFTYIPFNLINLRTTKDFVETIKSVRTICDEFSAAGLPNYPTGTPFIFWEQYIWLGEHLLIAVAIVLSASFVVMAVILCNFWAAMLIVIVLVMITVEVYGFMGLAGIKLSAVPAVTLILSVGVGVEFTVHMCMQFLTSAGDRNQRMQRAVEHVFSPVVDGAISTLLGVIMLAGSDFDFIVRYFFHLLAALIVIGTLNGLVFLPVLLSLAGPGPEVEKMPPPGTASSSGSNRELFPSSTCRHRTPPADSEVCILERIAREEERSSGSRGRRAGHKRGAHKSNSRSNRRANRSRSPPVDSDSSSSTVTRVTARATVTVEVHTEQVSAERSSYQNFRGGAQVGPIHNQGEIDEEDVHVTNLECDGIRR